MTTTTLTRELRKQLEHTISAARAAAETGAAKALTQLGVGDAKSPSGLTPAQATQRNALRAHGRQLGDRRDAKTDKQDTGRLRVEVAYQHWHRMLFARFLAENELLIEPDSAQSINLADCQELAREQGEDWLALASRYAETMLPQIFRSGDPALALTLPPETRSQLEELMEALPAEVFAAEDSLGWVYQYWQADHKKAINASETKIGADELPAVTQLFTEDYMVWFLLHNTLGAWWAGKVLAANPRLAANAKDEGELRAACRVGDVDWTYLRFVRDEGKPWRPAAGTFEGWPRAAKDIKVLDPCMGSGHFLVFALPLLAALRAAEEKLTPDAAIEAVLRDNLHGLEIDPRCTQIAAFNLALAAWRRIGFKPLPALHLACSGLALGVSKAEWLKLAERAVHASSGTKPDPFSDATQRGLENLYDLFTRAPWLGSLIDPAAAGGDLVTHGFKDLEPLLAKVMQAADGSELAEMAIAAQGLAKAAELLAGKFTLVTTNPPYLKRGSQDEVLLNYCASHHHAAKRDLATCFVERCLAFSSGGATAALVTPQNWLFLSTYKHLRENLLQKVEWNAMARLGEHGFESLQAAGAFTAMLVLTQSAPRESFQLHAIDASARPTPQEKAAQLQVGECTRISQASQLDNPDSRIAPDVTDTITLLSTCANAWQGIASGDFPRFGRCFFEIRWPMRGWTLNQSTVSETTLFGGKEHVLFWEDGYGAMTEVCQDHAPFRGKSAWGLQGIACSQMRGLAVTLYEGTKFDNNTSVLTASRRADLPAIWCFCSSPEYNEAVRQVDQSLKVTNATLVKVPFDLARWQKVAAEKYPQGLPKPYSDDPTQWLFHGHPQPATAPLQVAVARLLGYRWPAETDAKMELSDEARAWVAESAKLASHADDDGIVALDPVQNEQPAAQRLIALLRDAYGKDWAAAKLAALLADAGATGKKLDDWLRDSFFEQHCALFHNRPFIWHVWDGRRDGFHALVNYHRLAAPAGEGKRTLSKLTYSYLGDWINRQRAEQKAGVEGADGRLASAEHLQHKLEAILAGEPPYDLFVRWKPLAEQPIGWEPDINDGVRINIRPFMTAQPYGARAGNACILRKAPNIKWTKDRGKEPERDKPDYPWFWGWDEAAKDFAGGKAFDGNRWNDLHYSVAAKQAARAKAGKP